jgi:hypothetical protein
MNTDEEGLVYYDFDKLPPGRIDRSRMGKPRDRNSDDDHLYPFTTPEDLEATRQLAIAEGWYRKKQKA